MKWFLSLVQVDHETGCQYPTRTGTELLEGISTLASQTQDEVDKLKGIIKMLSYERIQPCGKNFINNFEIWLTHKIVDEFWNLKFFIKMLMNFEIFQTCSCYRVERTITFPNCSTKRTNSTLSINSGCWERKSLEMRPTPTEVFNINSVSKVRYDIIILLNQFL